MRVDAVNNNRQFYRFADFRGVDYSSSPLEVQSNRATDMANLILRDGVLHKRNGFEQVGYLFGTEEDGAIKGAWIMNRYEMDSNGYDHEVDVLIYIQGQKVMEYNITDGGVPTPLYESTGKKIGDSASAFFSGHDLYILCGDFLQVKGSSTAFDVRSLLEDEKGRAYIPTTTKNIVREGSALEYKERVLVEPINALTAWRKNQLTWEEYKGSGSSFYYVLDAKCDMSAVYELDVPVLYVNGEKQGKFTRDGNEYILSGAGYGLDGEPGFRTVIWNSNDDGRARIYFPHTETIPTDAEVIVEFKDNTSASLSRVGSVGAVYGNDGRADRLFFATGNFVRYTENTLDYLPDFTYVPATNFVRCGSTGEITAMLRLSNGTLAVFKDVKNRQEPSVYYISGRYVDVETDETDAGLIDDVFSVRAGNIEESCPSPYGIATLAGDSLFVSQSGVYGIELSGNVAADDRFARERSRIINSKLTKFDLSKAKAVVYDNRYYLAVGGEHNEVYVADARYKYTAEGDSPNTFNYEWFRWTDIPVALWLLKDNELWFISTDNFLCRFTDKYEDKYLTAPGEATVSGTRVYFNKDLYPIVKKALYAEYDAVYGVKRYLIDNLHNYGTDASPKWAFTIPLFDGPIKLSFVVPINAYWKSAVTDFGSSVHRKNMYSLSVVVQPVKHGRVAVGYTTRLRDWLPIEAEGANTFNFGDLSFEGFLQGDSYYQMFSFDTGNFISAYRQKVFERNFVYAQFVFACNFVGDCVVEELSAEYAINRKNIGAG